MVAGATCGRMGRLSGTHAMCMPIKLADFARCLYEAYLAGNVGFTLKTKNGPGGLYTYVEMQLELVDWPKWGPAC